MLISVAIIQLFFFKHNNLLGILARVGIFWRVDSLVGVILEILVRVGLLRRMDVLVGVITSFEIFKILYFTSFAYEFYLLLVIS